MTNQTPLVELEGVTKRFGDNIAVDNLSYTVKPGEIFGLLGHNGAGKTTTIRMILNLIKPDGGRISVMGKPVSQEVKDSIGYLPEERGLYKKMKVRDLLVFFGEINGLSKSHAKQETDAWLKRLELYDRRNDKAEEFSKGMQQKLQWISAVIHRPPLLILDEPFSGLDPVNANLFEEMIHQVRDQGTAIMFSTHVLEQAENLIDHVVMLKQGQAVVAGALEQVKAQFGSRWVQVDGENVEDFLGQVSGVGEVRHERKRTRFRLEDGVRRVDVLKQLLDKGFDPKEFSQVEPTLKEIFLHKVGGVDMDGEYEEAVQ